jgi:mitochondrial fission protein ELM1
MTGPLIWVLCDDRPGTAAQALGVADALGHPYVAQSVRYAGLARLPNILRGATLVGVDADTRTRLAPPWPDVVIAAGRRSAPVARWIKRQAAHRVILAHIMNPGRTGAGDFDLIALPHHDCVRPGGDAPNVIRITGAPHRLTPARLTAAAEAWRGALAGLPRPYIALLVGGATRQQPFPEAAATALGEKVAAMAHAVGGSVLLLTSRRTGAAAQGALLRAIPEPRAAYLWGQGGDNPYVGYLALADAIVVTGDSVSMCCEACATPAAVFIAATEGLTAPKHQRLHAELYARGLARPFDGAWAEWDHPPLNAATDVAAALTRLLPSS